MFVLARAIFSLEGNSDKITVFNRLRVSICKYVYRHTWRGRTKLVPCLAYYVTHTKNKEKINKFDLFDDWKTQSVGAIYMWQSATRSCQYIKLWSSEYKIIFYFNKWFLLLVRKVSDFTLYAFVAKWIIKNLFFTLKVLQGSLFHFPLILRHRFFSF